MTIVRENAPQGIIRTVGSGNANRIISYIFPAALIETVYFLKDFLSHLIGYLIQSYIFIHRLLLSHSVKVFFLVNIRIYEEYSKRRLVFFPFETKLRLCVAKKKISIWTGTRKPAGFITIHTGFIIYSKIASRPVLSSLLEELSISVSLQGSKSSGILKCSSCEYPKLLSLYTFCI